MQLFREKSPVHPLSRKREKEKMEAACERNFNLFVSRYRAVYVHFHVTCSTSARRNVRGTILIDETNNGGTIRSSLEASTSSLPLPSILISIL